MNATQFLKNAILLIAALALFGVKLAAQDKITFTWHADGSEKKVNIGASEGELSINWGDGTIETISMLYGANLVHTYTKDGEYVVTFEATSLDCKFNSFWCHDEKVNKLDLTHCSNLFSIECYNNQLTDLNLSNSSNLKIILCENNQISYLDFTDLTDLYLIGCDNNKLKLSNLFAAHLLVNDLAYKKLGAQYLSPQTVIVEEELFADQSVFDGEFTKYSVSKNGETAPVSDYTVIDGKLIFNTIGKYIVTMTNDAIVSHPRYPAKVIATLDVCNVGIIENGLSNINIYPNPTNGELIIDASIGSATGGEFKIENIEIFDFDGRKQSFNQYSISSTNYIINISHLTAGVYFLNINGQITKIIKK